MFDHSKKFNDGGNKIEPIRACPTDPLADVFIYQMKRVTSPGPLSPRPLLVGQAFWRETDRQTNHVGTVRSTSYFVRGGLTSLLPDSRGVTSKFVEPDTRCL